MRVCLRIHTPFTDVTNRDDVVLGRQISECWVDPGPVIKRFMPKDRGKAYSILKRTSHLIVTIDEREEKKK